MGRILLDFVSETILNFVFFILKFVAWGIQWTAALVVFLAVMAGAAYYVFMVTLEGGEPVQVPNIVNLPRDEAAARLAEQGLSVGKEETIPHDSVPRFHIISQRPAPGRVVRTGRKVYLTVSGGKDFLIAPSLEKRPLDDVREELASSQFRLGSVSRIPSSSPRNIILAQDPPPGESIEKSSNIHLLVSDGDAQYKDYMPDLRSKPISDITGLLAPYNVVIVPNMVTDIPGAREDIVLNQDPQPATLIFDGQIVTYDVKPSGKIPVPDTRFKAEFKYEMPYDWYSRDVHVDVIDRYGNRRVETSFPPAFDDASRATRVTGSSLYPPVPIPYIERCNIEIVVDNKAVVSYAFENGQEPVKTENP